jgi:hypothetical protein
VDLTGEDGSAGLTFVLRAGHRPLPGAGLGRIVPLHVNQYIRLANVQEGLSAQFLRFSIQLLQESFAGDEWAILKLQARRAKRFQRNPNSEVA